ncbi:MAG: YraN family protein [Thermodesulfobacteriota bacterium]
MSKKRLSLGRRGEELAGEYLKKAGYKILELNYRGRLGEIDLVAEDGDCLVFVEVKTRAGLAFGHPLESINSRKQYQLIRAAREYLAEHGAEERICRFDAVSVLQKDGQAPQLELIKNAFELDGENF